MPASANSSFRVPYSLRAVAIAVLLASGWAAALRYYLA